MSIRVKHTRTLVEVVNNCTRPHLRLEAGHRSMARGSFRDRSRHGRRRSLWNSRRLYPHGPDAPVHAVHGGRVRHVVAGVHRRPEERLPSARKPVLTTKTNNNQHQFRRHKTTRTPPICRKTNFENNNNEKQVPGRAMWCYLFHCH